MTYEENLFDSMVAKMAHWGYKICFRVSTQNVSTSVRCGISTIFQNDRKFVYILFRENGDEYIINKLLKPIREIQNANVDIYHCYKDTDKISQSNTTHNTKIIYDFMFIRSIFKHYYMDVVESVDIPNDNNSIQKSMLPVIAHDSGIFMTFGPDPPASLVTYSMTKSGVDVNYYNVKR